MPAIAEEVEAAEHEGAKIAYLAAPQRIIGDAEGKVRGIEVVRLDPGGRASWLDEVESLVWDHLKPPQLRLV